MNKIFSFIIIAPFIALLLFKAVAFYEYDTKQRYIKNILDTAAYKVKITGILTTDEYNELKIKLNKLAAFNDADIVLKKGSYGSDGVLSSSMSGYSSGEKLKKGDSFAIYIKSSSVSGYSRLQNGGVSGDDSKNLYYRAKAVCRVEK